MADPVRKLLKKIRGIPSPPPPPPEPLWKQYVARREAEAYRAEFWERDKKRNREVAFEKAKIRLEEWREERRQEKLRLEEIAEQRLNNLKKARRKLKRMREEGDS